MSIFWNDGTSLYHYGTPGMRWGARKWQNKDGSLTPAGYEHYGYGRASYRRNTPHYVKDGAINVSSSSSSRLIEANRQPLNEVDKVRKERQVEKEVNQSTRPKLTRFRQNVGELTTRSISTSELKKLRESEPKLTKEHKYTSEELASMRSTKKASSSEAEEVKKNTEETPSKAKDVTKVNPDFVDSTVVSTHMKNLGLKYVTKTFNTFALQYEDDKYKNNGEVLEDRRRAGKKRK